MHIHIMCVTISIIIIVSDFNLYANVDMNITTILILDEIKWTLKYNWQLIERLV